MHQVVKTLFAIFSLVGHLWSQSHREPIYVHMVIHIEDLNAPPGFAYERKVRNLAWLVNYLDSLPDGHRPLPTIQIQGDFAETSLMSSPTAELVRQTLLAAYNMGLTFGVHAHPILHTPDGRWIHVQLPRPSNMCSPADTYALYLQDSSTIVHGMNSHIRWVDSLVKVSLGFLPPQALISTYSGAYAPAPQQRWRLMAGNFVDSLGQGMIRGFLIETNHPGEECFFSSFHQSVWNPFRPGTEGILDEDLSQQFYIRIPTAGVVGSTAEHIGIWQDQTVEAKQKDFIMLWLNRRYIKHAGLQDKLWCVGVTMHLYNLEPPDSNGYDLEQRRDEFKRFINWLNEHFIGRVDLYGDTIAVWATTLHIYHKFLEWEQHNPGVSSFEYMPVGFDLAAYPYPLKGLVKFLHNTHFDTFIVDNDTLLVAKFDACPSIIRGDSINGYWVRDNIPIGGTSYCRCAPSQASPLLQTYPIYVLFSEFVDTVDFYALTGELDSFAFVSGLDGHLINEDGHQLPVTFVPIIAVPMEYMGVLEEYDRYPCINCGKWVSFNPPNTVVIQLTAPERISLAIYDAFGRKIREIGPLWLTGGLHEIELNWRPKSGVYFVKVQTQYKEVVQKLVIVK